MNSFVWKTVLIISISGATMGFDTGLMTGAMLDLRNSFPALDRSETLRRWLVSTAPIGAIIGAALAVFLNDFYGRKESLKASNFFYLFGTIIITVSQHHILLFLGRFVEGVGIGLITVTCPLFIAEGSHPRDRSRLVIVFVLMVLVGRFFAGMATSILKEATGTWRPMFGMALLFPCLQLAFFKLISESPYWKLMMLDWAGAREIFERVYAREAGDDEDPNIVAEEIDDLIIQAETVILDDQATNVGRNIFTKLWYAFRTKGMLKALMIGVCAQGIQLFLGVNSILYYVAHIGQNSGSSFEELPPQIGIIYVVTTFFGALFSYYLITSVPKRLMLLLSTLAGLIAIIIYSIFFVPQMGVGKIEYDGSHQLPTNVSCTSYLSAYNQSLWTCATCLKNECDYCASETNYHVSGICMASSKDSLNFCTKQRWNIYNLKCPSKIGYLNSVLLIGYMVCYSTGLSTVPWIIISELFPTNFRALGGAIASAFNWLSIALVRMIGAGNIEAFFSGIVICLCAMFYLWKFIPESHGVGLDEVFRIFNPPPQQNSPPENEPASNPLQHEGDIELTLVGRDRPSQDGPETDENQEERPLLDQLAQDVEREEIVDENILLNVNRRGQGRGQLAERGGRSLNYLIRGHGSNFYQDRRFSV